MSVHVSRTTLRFGRGNSSATKSTVRSRSKIQYAAVAKVKKIAIRISNAFSPKLTPEWNSFDARGRCSSRFWIATRIVCLIPCEWLAACFRSDAFVGRPCVPSADSTWLRARGTASQSRRAIRPKTAT